MIKFKEISTLLALFTTLSAFGTFQMEAPKGWDVVSDASQLPKKVECVYIGAAGGALRPTLNVALEMTENSLADYYHSAKKYHSNEPDTFCQDLGSIMTRSGEAKLMQIDRASSWGAVRFVQATLILDHVAYVITGTCLRDEFGTHCPHFFEAIQSFSIEK